MTTKSTAAIADTVTAAAPAKPKRVRKPVLKAVSAGHEEAAVARLHQRIADVERTPLRPSDLYLKPILLLDLLDDGGLTITPIDVAAGARLDLPGSSVPIEVHPGPVYRLGKSSVEDLCFILGGSYRDADAEHTRVVESLVKDLDEADRAKGHAEEIARAALHRATTDSATISVHKATIVGLEAKLSEKSSVIIGHQLANSNCRRRMEDDAARIAELELQLAAAQVRPPLLERLRAVVSPAAGRA